MRRFLATLGAVALSLSVFARIPAAFAGVSDSCESVNLSDRGGSMAHIPVTFQGGEPDCYANAAAYMTSAFIQAHLRTKHRTSPDAIYADVLAGDSAVEDANTGRTCNAIGVVQRYGSCDQAALDRILYKVRNRLGPNYDWLDTLQSEYELGTGKYHLRGQAIPADDRERANGVCRNLEDDLKLPEGLTPEMAEILGAIKKSDPGSFYAAETERICDQPGERVYPGKGFPSLPACQKLDFLPELRNGRKILRSPDEIAGKIHQLLSAGKTAMPVGIEYCSAVLFKDGAYITRRDFRTDINYLNTPEATENFGPTCGFHASVIIGQKMIHGQCNFLVQNSWGKDCSGFSKKTRPCKNGRIWIPAGQLSRNILRLSYF